MTTQKPDAAHTEGTSPFTSAPPAAPTGPVPAMVPDSEATQVMMPPLTLRPLDLPPAAPRPAAPPPAGIPGTEPDAEATQVMMPSASPLLRPSSGDRPPLTLPPRPSMAPPPVNPPAAPTMGAPVPSAAPIPVTPPATAPVMPAAASVRATAEPMAAERTGSSEATPTLAASGYEQTMILKPGEEKPRTVTMPSPRKEPAATLPGNLNSLGDGSMQQVGRYMIRERLGRGGMATVYKAHDPTLNRDVAIKFLHASLCADEEYRDRFLREARAAGGLSHPNIVVVHDVGEIDGRPYMAMELIDGSSIADDLEKNKSMPIRDVVVIGLQLARALDYAHGKGIVHRDIKPGNIMRLKGSHTIKVMDFGIAHIEELGEVQHTRVGDVLGTPQYMSPEQANGEKLDGRSDLFSAGIVMYQMLTGRRPFRGDTLVAVATRIANEEPTSITKQRADVPASLRRVVDRCLAKQPANRFQSGRELSEALTKVLNELDEAALAKNRPRIVPLRVKWAATMALIVAVVMGLTAAVITQRQYTAMMGQVSDYGASLARFIAKQNAASVLGDDWPAVEAAVAEVMKTGNFERINVIDLTGVVRVSSQAELVGQPYKPVAGESLGKLAGTATTRYTAQNEPVLGFEAPITFQDKQVGRVALGIPERPLTQVARLSITLMAVLAIVTVLAVAIAMYFVANWFAKPIQLVADSMAEIGKGRFDHRINEQRKDEFGQLYAAFDSMAQALQDRATAGLDPLTPPPGGPLTQVPRRDAPETAKHRKS